MAMETPKKPSTVPAAKVVGTTATTLATILSTTTTTTTSSSTTSTARSSPIDSPPPSIGVSSGKEKLTESQCNIQRFWPAVMREVQLVDSVEPGNQLLPLARIKKIMKLDEDVKMISSDAPLLFAKAIEIFIQELTLRAWQHTEHNKRRTLQRSDIAMAITKYDQFDFLIDIVPRDEIKKEFEGAKSDDGAEQDGTAGTASTATPATSTTATNEDLQYILQLAQQQLAQHTGKVLELTTVRSVPVSHQDQVMQAVADAFHAKKTIATTATTAAGAVAATPTALAVTRTAPFATMKLGKVLPAVLTGDPQATAIAIAPTTLQQQQQASQGALQTATGPSIILTNGNATSTTTTTTTTTTTSGVSNGGTVSTSTGQPLTANPTLQLFQHVMTPSGELTQIPITIPQNQINFIRTAVATGQPNVPQW
uniref:Nuclear transcription factor Y subunit gamma n=1 Tax=Anopheles farauti TaxID=69004 RepID=A0A182QTH2_9DIPT